MNQKIIAFSILLWSLAQVGTVAAEGPNINLPVKDTIRGNFGPSGALDGSTEREKYDIFGLVVPIVVQDDLLRDQRLSSENPTPPKICGTPSLTGKTQRVWISEDGRKEGREIAEVVAWTGEAKAGPMEAARHPIQIQGKEVRPSPTIDPPMGCSYPKLWELPVSTPLIGLTAADFDGHTTAFLPVIPSVSGSATVRVLEDEDEPGGYLDNDLDLRALYAALDPEWLDLTLEVDGKVVDGTGSPLLANVYGVTILDPAKGDRFTKDGVKAKVAVWLPLYRLLNNPPSVLADLSGNQKIISSGNLQVRVEGNQVHFRIKRDSLGLGRGKILRVSGFTAQVPQMAPVTQIKLMDVSAMGQIQAP